MAGKEYLERAKQLSETNLQADELVTELTLLTMESLTHQGNPRTMLGSFKSACRIAFNRASFQEIVKENNFVDDKGEVDCTKLMKAFVETESGKIAFDTIRAFVQASYDYRKSIQGKNLGAGLDKV
ncbi:MAG: hypothetical protein KDJ50_01935, partial [Alphaproteobacteria bacterium]|nr:hypothetical protein [Alphaproteobacteria bacterium]